MKKAKLRGPLMGAVLTLTVVLSAASPTNAEIVDPSSTLDPVVSGDPVGDTTDTIGGIVEDTTDTVGSVVGTVEEVVQPEEQPPPPPNNSTNEDPAPPPNDPTPEGNSDEVSYESSAIGENVASTQGTVVSSGTSAPGSTPQAVDSTAGVISSVSQVLRVNGDPDPIGYSPSYGRRSTQLVVDLLRGVHPAKAARILAPFPVWGLATYSDDWGQPRHTPYFHPHEGTDIFAEPGTPVIASARGTISDLTPVSAVGGTTLRLTAPDGTYFYYAHLSGFAPGLFEGKEVALGEVIGFVGHSGNAEGTPDHLHYEIHPRGGRAVPPVPYLDRWLEEALRSAKALRSSPSSGLGRFLARVPAALGAQGQNLASHLNGDPAGVSTRATLASWGAILGAIGGTLARRRLRGRRQTFAEDPLEYVAEK